MPYNDGFLQDAVEAVERGYVPEARLDAAVDRVLALKHKVGLVAPENAPLSGALGADPAGLEAGRAAEEARSRAAAEQGIVLLKNEPGALPLPAEGVVAVVGPSAKSAANLVGGWSVHWQGPDNEGEVAPPPFACRCLLP